MVKHKSESPASTEQFMEEICQAENCKQALARVKANKGSPGIDGMTVEKLSHYLKQHWPKVGEQLLSGTYKPQPVKRVEIPKRDGGMRILPNSFACIRTSHHDVICIIGCLFFGG